MASFQQEPAKKLRAQGHGCKAGASDAISLARLFITGIGSVSSSTNLHCAQCTGPASLVAWRPKAEQYELCSAQAHPPGEDTT